MSSPRSLSPLRHVCFASGLALLVSVSASAQSSLNPSSSTEFISNQPGAGESSSTSFQPGFDDGASSASALRDAAASMGNGGSGAAAQDDGGHHSMFSRLAFEAGGGANGPTGDSTGNITWGGNFTVGGGLHFARGLSLLAEYQFLDDKLPGNLIAETGANGGNAHIWSLTLDPMIDLLPKRTNSVYVTGGGGFYRKVTNFTDPEETEYCDYYFCEPGVQNQVVGHFSSNQGGWNIGAGVTHRFGGTYNDGTMKVFAEARYLDVLTPASAIAPNGLGTATVGAGTKLVPITVGLRW
jgi:hypothetical protein